MARLFVVRSNNGRGRIRLAELTPEEAASEDASALLVVAPTISGAADLVRHHGQTPQKLVNVNLEGYTFDVLKRA